LGKPYGTAWAHEVSTLDPEANPQASDLGRLFGVRDVAPAFGLTANGGRQREQPTA
jgi:hypothetical protein